MSEARIPEDIAVSQLRDPFGQALYPDVVGRDGSRTPMPWQATAISAGFSDLEDTWLPIPDSHRPRAVDAQNEDPSSLLNTWRRLLHWRRRQPALMQGDCNILDTEPPIFAFVREAPQQRLLCIFNLSADTAYFNLTKEMLPCNTATGANPTAKRNDGMLRLRGYSYFFGNLQPSTQPANSGTGIDFMEDNPHHLSKHGQTNKREELDETSIPEVNSVENETVAVSKK